MSTIRKQPRSKYYFVDIRVGKRRLRKSLGTADRKLALLKAKKLQLEFKGKSFPSTYRTLEELKVEYLDWAASRKTPSSLGASKAALSQFAKFVGTDRRLDQITVKDVDSFISMTAGRVKPISANFYLRSLKAIFEVAKRWGYVGENVWKQIRPLRYELPPPRILSPDEIRSFLKQTRKLHPQLEPLMDFYLLTGARRSEALSLSWEDVDFERNEIVLKKTKGKRSRKIPMLKQIREIMKDRRELPKPFPFSADTVSRKAVAIAEAAGIKGASLHDLRKSFASYLADAGMPDFLIVSLMGHQDRETTQRHYIGQFDGMLRKWMQKAEKTLLPPR
jgi:integrase